MPDDEWFSQQADGLITPGDYGKIIDAGRVTWFVCTPDGARFMLASPHSPDSAGRSHEVEEHDDGTITIEPRPGNSNSILSPQGWHGWLYRGVWR